VKWRVALLFAALFHSPGVVGAIVSTTWCELITPEFHLISDLDEAGLRDLQSLLSRFGPFADPYLPGQPVVRQDALKVIVFSSRGDFRRLTGKRKFAAFMQPSLQTNRLLIGPMRGSLTETTLHEYAHYLLRNRLDVSLPMWFDEGLASLLGEVEFDAGEAIVGRLPVDRMLARMNSVPEEDTPLASLSRTLSATSMDGWSKRRIEAFYDWSWLVTHYLYFTLLQGKDFLDGEDPIDGEQTPGFSLDDYLATGDLSINEYLGRSERGLLRDLERHLRRPPAPHRKAFAARGPEQGSFACLDDLRRDHELADAIAIQHPDMARKLLAPHLPDQAGNGELLVSLARIEQADDNQAEALSLSEQARSLAPDSASAMILVANLKVQDCLFELDEDCRARWQAATPLFRSALKQDSGRFDAVLGLGLSYLYTGRPGEAVNYLRVAYTRAPWAAVTNFYLGESYRLIGDTRSVGYLNNARNWANLEIWRALAEASLRLLRAPEGAAGAAEGRSDSG